MFSDPCLMGWHWPLHLLIYCEKAINTFKFRTGAVISCKEFFYEKHKVAFVLHWRNRTRTSAVMWNVHACVWVFPCTFRCTMWDLLTVDWNASDHPVDVWGTEMHVGGSIVRRNRVKQKLISQKRKNVTLLSFRFIILCFRCAIDLWSMCVCE